MARIKGQKMTEEQKAAMRAKRLAKKQTASTAYKTVRECIEHLSYDELIATESLITKCKQQKREEEICRIEKEIAEKSIKLNKLKEN